MCVCDTFPCLAQKGHTLSILVSNLIGPVNSGQHMYWTIRVVTDMVICTSCELSLSMYVTFYLWPACWNFVTFSLFLWAILSAYQQVAGYKRLRMMTNCFVYIFSIVYYLLYKPFVKLLYSIFLPLIVSIYIDMFNNKCCFSTKHPF